MQAKYKSEAVRKQVEEVKKELAKLKPPKGFN
jgi:hypothetical protein